MKTNTILIFAGAAVAAYFGYNYLQEKKAAEAKPAEPAPADKVRTSDPKPLPNAANTPGAMGANFQPTADAALSPIVKAEENFMVTAPTVGLPDFSTNTTGTVWNQASNSKLTKPEALFTGSSTLPEFGIPLVKN